MRDGKIRKALNQLVKKIHKTAKIKGWWDKDRSSLEIHALIHTEISEATEDVRNDVGFYEFDSVSLKPYGEAIELIDAVIRIMDYFGKKGWDFGEMLFQKMIYNKTREYRHGGKEY